MVGIAERTGLMSTLSFWTLNAAFRQAAQWRESGINPRLAVNLALSSLSDRELPPLVDPGVKTWGLDPAQVPLESTRAGDRRGERPVAISRAIKAIGVGLPWKLRLRIFVAAPAQALPDRRIKMTSPSSPVSSTTRATAR